MATFEERLAKIQEELEQLQHDYEHGLLDPPEVVKLKADAIAIQRLVAWSNQESLCRSWNLSDCGLKIYFLDDKYADTIEVNIDWQTDSIAESVETALNKFDYMQAQATRYKPHKKANGLWAWYMLGEDEVSVDEDELPSALFHGLQDFLQKESRTYSRIYRSKEEALESLKKAEAQVQAQEEDKA